MAKFNAALSFFSTTRIFASGMLLGMAPKQFRSTLALGPQLSIANTALHGQVTLTRKSARWRTSHALGRHGIFPVIF